MKPLFLAVALLLATPSIAQTAAPAAPSMLADVQDEIKTAGLKPLKKQNVTLKPSSGGRAETFVTLESEGLTFKVSVAEFAKARSASAKVQQKYDRALKYLRDALKANRKTIALNQPETRDLEHLLAAWALPQGRVGGITFQGQPITTYTMESYGGNRNQPLYPEGQVFYFYQQDRTSGFYTYMNVPKEK